MHFKIPVPRAVRLTGVLLLLLSGFFSLPLGAQTSQSTTFPVLGRDWLKADTLHTNTQLATKPQSAYSGNLTAGQVQQKILTNIPFDLLEASQYNIGKNGVANTNIPTSTLSQFKKFYTTGYFKKKWYGPGSDGLIAYERLNPPPAILGPNPFRLNGPPIEHLLDNHHRVSGLYLLTTIFTNGFSSNVTVVDPQGVTSTVTIGPAPTTVYVEQILDWSSYDINRFWREMAKGNTGGVTNFAPVTTNGSGFWDSTNQPTYVWAYDKGVPQNLLKNPPPMIPNLTDDTLRDIGAQITYPNGKFTLDGYQTRDDAMSNDIQNSDGNGIVLYYQEFYWANYLRSLVYLKSGGTNPNNPMETNGMDPSAPNSFTNYEDLIAFAADNLCHQTNASKLPGWYDPGSGTNGAASRNQSKK